MKFNRTEEEKEIAELEKMLRKMGWKPFIANDTFTLVNGKVIEKGEEWPGIYLPNKEHAEIIRILFGLGVGDFGLDQFSEKVEK